MSALTDADREGLYANELALDNLHAAWARDTFESAIEAIVARHVAAALNDLADRCANAERGLADLTEHATGLEISRLKGKRSGVALARSYIREVQP